MAGSAAYARIKAQVLTIVDAIPPGRVTTHRSIGEHLDVMPRHVAYVLSQLDDASKMVHPWHRVVSADGSLGVPKRAPDGATQAELLRAEGILLVDHSVADILAGVFIEAASLDHGLPKQTRPMPSAGTRSSTGPRRRPG
jgi:methylated-DNA-protein-cysteine methyltransferase-like protein